MTRKHFQLIADVICELDVDKAMRAKIAQAFADELVHENPRFDTVRFLRACDPVEA